jgi:hypothetical protein
MKLALYAICAVAIVIGGTGCTTGGGATGGQAAVPGAVVTVQYINPQNFTDFSVQGRNVQSSTTVFTGEVTSTLEPVMTSRFPGDVLTLRFTDIDLAGSGSARRPGSTRIVRSNTPARLSFDYVLRDSSGHTAASGSQRLTDTLRRTSTRNPGQSSPVYLENRMLRRWLQSLPVTR